jgi:hypothetical protein
MEEPGRRDVVVPMPSGRWRTILPILGLAWVVMHLLIPLRYYLPGSDRYDERFAWRMFSAVRVQHCNVTVTELFRGRERTVALLEILPAPWVALLERNRPAVIEHFLRWRCQHEGTSEVRFRNACTDASGDPVPIVERTIDCARGTIRTPTSEGRAGGASAASQGARGE